MPLSIQRASAGSGKTQQLARHYLQILFSKQAVPVDPATILALTFTREAAGEILSRIFSMLAAACHRSEDSKKITEGSSLPPPSPRECQQLLRTIVLQIDRLNIGTIDALLAQQAHAFALDLGMKPFWEVADEITASHLAEKTVLQLLEEEPSLMKDWSILHEFEERLSFIKSASRLLERHQILGKMKLYEQVPPVNKFPHFLSYQEQEAARVFLENFPVPRTAKGKPNVFWLKALEKIKNAFTQPLALKDLLDQSSLFLRILEENPQFYREEIPQDFLAFFSPLAQASREEKCRLALLQEAALKHLAQRYYLLRKDYSFLAGKYTFSQIEEIVTSPSQIISKEEMLFRMDLTTEHLLLDEYQDTSERQHAFLLPLLEEILAKGGSAFIVGDIKQGIYGWRGGRRHLLSQLEEEYQPYLLLREPLYTSYRSAPAILEAVNHVFGALKDEELIARMQAGDAFRKAAQQWSGDFQPHQSAPLAASLCGRVHLHQLPWNREIEEEELGEQTLQKVVELVQQHRQEDPLREIAVLMRRTKFIPSLLLKLREEGIMASGEGGNPLADTLGVEVLLSLLSWIDHPGHCAADHHLKHSPLADLVASEERASLRQMLLELGYARCLRDWSSRPLFKKSSSHYEQVRIEQFIEMAHRFDARGGGTPSELVMMAREERLESSTNHPVRMMSLHAAKGLEFQSVILMDLETSIFGNHQQHLQPQIREGREFFIQRNYDFMKLQGREELAEELQVEQWEEALSLLYVGMTRAISYLDLVIRATARETAPHKSIAAWLRITELLPCANKGFSSPEKHNDQKNLSPLLPKASFLPHQKAFQRPPLLLKRSPSERSQRGSLLLAEQLKDRSAQQLGITKHQALAKIEWIDDAQGELLLEIEKNSDLVAVFDKEALLRSWRAWGITQLEVWRERRFALADHGELIHGVFDRVVLGGRSEENSSFQLTVATIIDFKTSSTPQEKKQWLPNYQLQLQEYEKALRILLPTLRQIETTIIWM